MGFDVDARIHPSENVRRHSHRAQVGELHTDTFNVSVDAERLLQHQDA
jgi:hypothetical protein